MTFKEIKKTSISFIKAIIRLIIGLKTPKGLIALFISFMIFYSWALIFIGYGFISSNHWFTGIGTAVIVFWAAPFTPFFPITILVTLFIQRVILRDAKSQSFRTIFSMYLGDAKDQDDQRLIALVEEKTDFADPTPEELDKANKDN